MSGEQQRISSASTRADDKTHSKDFSALQKLSVVGIALSTLGGIWFFISGQAASTFDVTLSPTSVAETITTNPALEQGLVGHWTFDGMDMDWSSTTAEVRDRSGQGNNGDAALNPTPTAGVLGQALHFTRILGQRITMVPPPATLEMGTADWTIATWYMPGSQVDGLHMIVNKGANDLTQEGYTFYHDRPNNTLMFYVSDGATRQHFSLTNVSLQSGNWYHIVGVAVRDGGVYFYINGEYAGQDWSSVYPGVDITDATRGLAIGGAIGLTWTFDGSLDDVRIYNRALSAEEVKRLYGLGATTHVAETITTNPALEQGLVGHWTFDGEQIDWGSTTAEVLNRTGNQNNANATGGMSTRSVLPGMLGQAMSFDGIDDAVTTGAHTSHDNLGPLTLAAWIRPSISGEYCMLGNGYLGPGNETWAFGVDSGDGLFFARAVASGILQRYSVFPVVEQNEWQHVAVTWDGSTDFFNGVKLFRNGVLLARQYSQNASPLGSDAGNAIEIGSVSGCAKAYKGDLDDMRVYNRALSAEEVGRLYQLGL